MSVVCLFINILLLSMTLSSWSYGQLVESPHCLQSYSAHCSLCHSLAKTQYYLDYYIIWLFAYQCYLIFLMIYLWFYNNIVSLLPVFAKWVIACLWLIVVTWVECSRELPREAQWCGSEPTHLVELFHGTLQISYVIKLMLSSIKSTFIYQ